jgi:hypothetical protein
VRLAIGALEGEVLLQFLIEAVVLSALGGLVGVLLALAASLALSQAMALPFLFNPGINALALAFSAAIGVLFGYFPARRAARLDPIEALRHERRLRLARTVCSGSHREQGPHTADVVAGHVAIEDVLPGLEVQGQRARLAGLEFGHLAQVAGCVFVDLHLRGVIGQRLGDVPDGRHHHFVDHDLRAVLDLECHGACRHR